MNLRLIFFIFLCSPCAAVNRTKQVQERTPIFSRINGRFYFTVSSFIFQIDSQIERIFDCLSTFKPYAPACIVSPVQALGINVLLFVLMPTY